MADGEYYGMMTFDQSLVTLIANGTIDLAEAMTTATNPHDLKVMLERQGILQTGQFADSNLELTSREPVQPSRCRTSGSAVDPGYRSHLPIPSTDMTTPARHGLKVAPFRSDRPSYRLVHYQTEQTKRVPITDRLTNATGSDRRPLTQWLDAPRVERV